MLQQLDGPQWREKLPSIPSSSSLSALTKSSSVSDMAGSTEMTFETCKTEGNALFSKVCLICKFHTDKPFQRPLSRSTWVSQLLPWFLFSSCYPEHAHSTGQNSVHPHGTSGCTPVTSINCHPKGFWSISFYRLDALSVGQPTVSKHSQHSNANYKMYALYGHV